MFTLTILIAVMAGENIAPHLFIFPVLFDLANIGFGAAIGVKLYKKKKQ